MSSLTHELRLSSSDTFFQRDLVTEEAVACRQEVASDLNLKHICIQEMEEVV